MIEPRVVYEDNHLLIVVKPPNLPTQADASGDTDLLSMMKADVKRRYGKPGEVYLGLVHRMDRPVGGLIALARTSKSAARLSEQLRAHDMHRCYWAVVRGQPLEHGTLRDFLLKDGSTNQVRVVAPDCPGAKEAVLRYKRLAQAEDLSLVSIELMTGRSHQIRVQLTSAGFPLWGDARYGGGKPGQQIALWGVALVLTHPTRKEILRFSAPPPDAYPWSLFPTYIAEEV